MFFSCRCWLNRKLLLCARSYRNLYKNDSTEVWLIKMSYFSSSLLCQNPVAWKQDHKTRDLKSAAKIPAADIDYWRCFVAVGFALWSPRSPVLSSPSGRFLSGRTGPPGWPWRWARPRPPRRSSPVPRRPCCSPAPRRGPEEPCTLSEDIAIDVKGRQDVGASWGFIKWYEDLRKGKERCWCNTVINKFSGCTALQHSIRLNIVNKYIY